ncbi:hypothetical protein AAC03nite_20390 [Alicyclobacillus acidoterrestris]|nr:hypothetical protein AAC03nite_20390 [Alicyclobacillus acidoterrestris]
MPTTQLTEHISSLRKMVEDGELEIAILRVGDTDIVIQPRSEMDARSSANTR